MLPPVFCFIMRCSSTSSGGSGTGAGSRDDEHGDGQDSSSRSGDDDGGDGTQACTPYAAAMLLLDAMRHRKTDELLLLVTDGPFSMLVLSALQPATTLPLTAALNTSSGSGSGGSFKPATHLEVDALAVRLKDSTLQVIIQEAKMTSSKLSFCLSFWDVRRVWLVWPMVCIPEYK